MKCNCGAFINPLWKQCQLCGTPKGNVIELLSSEILKKYAQEDWEEIKDSNEKLTAFSSMISDILIRGKGEIPPTYTDTTICKDCGEVPIPPSLKCGGYVLGCPWCFNRAKGLPIPKPANGNIKTKGE